MSCKFLIDSGAQVNTLTKESFKVLRETQKYKEGLFDIQEPDRSLKAYASSGEIKVFCTFEAFLHISEDRPTLLEKFYVVDECRSLLGRQTATRYSVLQLGLQVPVSLENSRFQLRNGREIATVEANETFPKFNISPIEISYDKTKPPCRNVFMNIPAAVKPLVETRLQHLLSANIIERVTEDMDTSFCSSMLVVPKGRDDIRLVIDLRGPNRYINRTPFSMPGRYERV